MPSKKDQTPKSPPKVARKAAPKQKAEPLHKSQALRLLEALRQKKAGGSDQSFARAAGKTALARNARKTGKGEVGGSNV